MKLFLRSRYLLMFALAWLFASARADAQNFGIIVSNAPATVAVNGVLNYSFSVTNGIGDLGDFEVTNTFSTPVAFLGFTNDHVMNLLSIVTNGNIAIFSFNAFTNADVINFGLSVQAPATGLLTNTIEAASVEVTNTAATNLVADVVTAISDLSVTLIGPAQAVITNDITFYSLFYTNFGPTAVPNVFLTNALPPGVNLTAVSPSRPGFTTVGTNMVFSLGTLASSAGGSFTFTIQPTSAGVVTFSASIGANGFLDSNTNNNTATTNVTIMDYSPGVLVAVTNSAQNLNHQNGFMEQSVRVSNTGGVDVTAVRVVVTGLTNKLFNAVGTNGSSPFVYLSAPLPAGQSATLLLQYVSLNRAPFPFANSQLHAFGVPPPSWTPPAATTTSTNINITRIVPLTNGDMLLEFPATPGLTYTIVYSDNMQFTNAMAAPPAITAQANEVQWIDYGPPATASVPMSTGGSRFYRVFQNP